MEMIERIFWFFDRAVIVLMVALIVLMLVRMIVDAADLNPFGAVHRTVRRLSDPMVFPARGFLRQFFADPKYAPIIVIIAIILTGLMVNNLVGTLAWMAQGIVWALSRGSIPALLGFIFHGLISIYILMVFLRVLFIIAMVGYGNRLMRFLFHTTEPLLGPLRKKIPPVEIGRAGRWDISPIVALILLWLLQAAISATLLKGARILI